MSVRRAVLAQVGGFNQELLYCYEDAEVCMRLVDANGRIEWVERALVRHERASSWLRDGEQVITDPYPLLFSMAVFVRQAAPAAAARVLAEVAAAWKDGPTDLVPEQQRPWFRERVASAISGGAAAGARPRAHAQLGPQPTVDFRPYA
jgi:hypothetical protein